MPYCAQGLYFKRWHLAKCNGPQRTGRGYTLETVATATEGRMIMATEFNTQVGNGKYCLQFETDNKEHYMLMQSLVRLCMDRTNIRLIDADSLIEDLEFLAKHEDSFRQSVILGVVHIIKSRIEIDSMKDCKTLEAMKDGET